MQVLFINLLTLSLTNNFFPDGSDACSMDTKEDIRLGKTDSKLCENGGIVAFGARRDITAGALDRAMVDPNGWNHTVCIKETEVELPCATEDLHDEAIVGATALKNVSLFLFGCAT